MPLQSARGHERRPEFTDARWRRMIQNVLRDPSQLVLYFQPIVSLDEAVVVGYEALSRFRPRDLDPAVCTRISPERWFAAADRLGLGAELEVLPLRSALEYRHALPANCFLTVNASPHLVTQTPIIDLILGSDRLDPLILELTEQTSVDDLSILVRLREDIAERGGFLALDDAGAGYSGLQHMTRIRPHMIKLDRTLVVDADHDEVKLALIELLGEFAGRIDAWLLAAGIETHAELDAFVRLGVPLGQGYLLGRPAPHFTSLAPALAEELRRANRQARVGEQVESLLERAWTTASAAAKSGTFPMHTGRIGVALDARGRPVRLLVPAPDRPRRDKPASRTHRDAPADLRVPAAEGLIQLAQRMMARAPEQRFDPAVCVDDHGRFVGIIRVERVLLALAAKR